MDNHQVTEIIERLIIEKLITNIIQHGYAISVEDAESTVLKRGTDPQAILHALFASDEETLNVYRDKQAIGYVFLVHGNGTSVISDYTLNLEPTMFKTQVLISAMEA